MLDTHIEMEMAYLVYSPGQHEQYYHPMSDVADGDVLNDVLEATNGGKEITPVSLSSIANRIISPSHTRSKLPIDIPGSMERGRFAFTLSFLITSQGAHGKMLQEREIIRGFTNHAELSRSGYIPDDMEFYINSRVLLKVNKPVSSASSKESRVIHFNHSVLGRNNRLDSPTPLRPEDAVAFAQSNAIRSNRRTVYDNRLSLDGITKVADRRHTIPNRWLASTLLSYKRGLNINADPDYYDESGDYAQVYGKAVTPSITNSHFYNAMMSRRAISNDDDNVFTFKEIDTEFPLAADKWVKIPKNRKNDIDLLNYTSDWKGSQMETIIACNLTYILPAVMNQLSLTRLEAVISNDNKGGDITVDVINYRKMFNDDDGNDDDDGFIEDIEYIQDQLYLDVVGLLDANGVVNYNLMINANLTWNSIYKIELEHQGVRTYSAPMFCDGYSSPLIDPGDNVDEDDVPTIAKISKTVDTIAISLIEAGREKRTAFTDFFDMSDSSPTKALAAPKGVTSRTDRGRKIISITSRRR